MKTDFVNLIFERYLDQVYPVARPAGAKLDPIQRAELKNAFFAAWWSALHELETISSTVSEPAACALLSAIQAECQSHAAAVIEKLYRSN